jgi:diphosphomevalonate decarboxylase
MKKIKVKAPANIAFIKYWGRYDHKLFLPLNPSISMTLSSCHTITEAELISDDKDIVEIKFYNQKAYTQILPGKDIKEGDMFSQIERIRKLAGSTKHVHIKSENSFPADAGIASSASGFSALTAALLLVYGLDEQFNDKIEFSKQIRLCGSASAARSGYGGFVELLTGKEHDDSYAVQLYDENYWELYDLVCVVDPLKKKVSSSKGHENTSSSAFMKARQQELPERIKALKTALQQKDLPSLGELIEQDALSMHAVMMTQTPSLLYWNSGTLSIIHQLKDLRDSQQIYGYFSMDAGANVHVITNKTNLDKLLPLLQANKAIDEIIVDKVGNGVEIIK